jgi:dipeptidase E
MIKALLLSNSTMPGTPFFTWPQPYVKDFLGNLSSSLVFIPYAAVTFSFDEYEEKVKEVFATMGYEVKSGHRETDPVKLIESAAGILVGGGNSFALLNRIYENDLLETIRTRVKNGTPYIGWSAGANLACPTIMTTNDMPVVQPPSLKALNLIPFQINPHYHELKFEGQGGETRQERLEEFIKLNPDKKVIGLPEGMLVELRDHKFLIKGDGIAKLYRIGQEISNLRAGDEFSWILAS